MPAVVLTLLEDRLYFRVKRLGAQVEIDEPGPGDLDLLELVGFRKLFRDGRGDVTRAAPGGLGEPHGQVGGEVPVSDVPGALDRALGLEPSSRFGEVGQAGQSVVEEFRYCGLH